MAERRSFSIDSTISKRGEVRIQPRSTRSLPSRPRDSWQVQSAPNAKAPLIKPSQSSVQSSDVQVSTPPKPHVTFNQPVQKLPTASKLAALRQKSMNSGRASSSVISDISPLNKPASQPVANLDQTSQLSELNVPKPELSVSKNYTSDTQSDVKKSSSRKLQFAFIAAATIVFVVGISVSVMSFRTNKHVEAQVQGINQAKNNPDDENAGDNPDEAPLSKNALSSHKVAHDAPRRLMIPKLNVNSRIIALGTKSNNELKAPTNIYDSGWFDKSAKLGQPGATLIDGHVSGPTKPGVFSKLNKLVAGDQIKVERGDGKIFTYKVVKSQTYDAKNTDMAASVAPVTPGKSGLNIITCAGKLDKKTNTYNERIMVFAELVE